jgi:NIPSNAP
MTSLGMYDTARSGTELQQARRGDSMNPTESDPCAVVELRQYTLHPGQRDTLIALFEREFIEPQEAVGITVIAQFRDLDRPDCFVWLRGFAGMDERAAALAAFYGGPVWAAHRDAANATMIDSDDVLLLRPVSPGGGLETGSRGPSTAGSGQAPPGLVVAQVCALAPGTGGSEAAYFARAVVPTLTRAGARIAGSYLTETSPNNFPRLPVREGENVFVWFAHFADARAHARWLERLAADVDWTGRIAPAWRHQLQGTPQTLRLAPTARSRRWS